MQCRSVVPKWEASANQTIPTKGVRAAARRVRENAAIESFFGTLKAKYFHLAAPKSMDALEAGVHDCVHDYNHERIKLGLQGLSPVEYRLRSAARSANS